jgi:hypothetical protein
MSVSSSPSSGFGAGIMRDADALNRSTIELTFDDGI